MHQREVSTPALMVSIALVPVKSQSAFAFVFYSFKYQHARGRETTWCPALAACLIAAIRLRGEPIQPSPQLKATIYDSVQLAMLVWREWQSRTFSPLN